MHCMPCTQFMELHNDLSMMSNLIKLFLLGGVGLVRMISRFTFTLGTCMEKWSSLHHVVVPLFVLVMSCTKEKASGVAFCNIDHAHHAFHSVVQMHLYFLMYKQCIEYLENCYNLFQIPDVAHNTM